MPGIGYTYFVSAGAEEIAEYDTAFAVKARYIPGPGTDEPIAMVACSGAGCATAVKSFFHEDKTGSVIAMSDVNGNMVEGPYNYDGYGNGPAATGVPYKFTGRRLDGETGLYYYRARFYAPALGRFLQTDPIGYQDGINWYAYVGNDPVNRDDPDGKVAQLLWGFAIGVMVEAGAQALTGELSHAIAEAKRGNYGPLERSMLKMGVSGVGGAATGGISSITRAVAMKAGTSEVAVKVLGGYAGALASAGTSATNATIDGSDPGKAAVEGFIGARIGGAGGQLTDKLLGEFAPTISQTVGRVAPQVISKTTSKGTQQLMKPHPDDTDCRKRKTGNCR